MRRVTGFPEKGGRKPESSLTEVSGAPDLLFEDKFRLDLDCLLTWEGSLFCVT